MRIHASLAAAAVLVLAPVALAAPPKGLWDGYGEGTWVTTKTVTKMVVPGADMPDQTQESRQTLVKVTDAEWTVKTETKNGDAWENAMEIKIPRKAPEGTAQDAPKPEDLGTENVSVDGKDYSCKKQKIVIAGSTTTSWVNDDQGTLKSVSESPSGTSEMTVTALAKSAKVGDKDVSCRETKVVTKGSGNESTMTMLTSDAVPGGTVRMEMSSAMGAMKSTTVTETTRFEKK
jgi:hypothetical protein